MSIILQPLQNRIVVKRVEEKAMSGSIHIPDAAKEKPQEADVIAVGPGRREKGERIPMEVHVGDRVLLGKYTGTEIAIDGQELLILNEDEVLGILAKAKTAKG